MTVFRFRVSYMGLLRPVTIGVTASNPDVALQKVRRMYPQHLILGAANLKSR
jgi:hypothetical protein